MSVDPFNGGGTAMTLLLTTPHDDREQRRLEGVRRRATVNTAGIAHRLGASAGDTRGVLEALGLVEPALKTILPPKKPVPTPEPPKDLSEVPVELTDRLGRRLSPQQRAAIARARLALAEADTEEVPPTGPDGKVKLRCGKRVHYRTDTNTLVRTDGAKQCLPCQKVSNARSILRNYGLLEAL
jgi:hypothetical protein